MSFFKKLFNKDSIEPRQLNQPKDLMIKDIIIFSDSFALPENLRNKQFQVANINTHEFEHKQITEWQLDGSAEQQIYLSLEQGQQQYLKLTMKVSDSCVEGLFNLDEFSEVFEAPGNALLNRLCETSQTAGWTSEQYQQTAFAQMGYFHRKDHRLNKPSEFEGEDSGEAFEFYSLRGVDDQYSVDIQIWQDGDTDVFVNLYRPTSDIKEYYPGS
ncbi:hypothetical protein RI844_09150 [Thalassotalea fonticola]|uniref:DUF4178 domain-containing protein n=1 Tax=Thalassotalea fonticola TaxID=3065649 RepID=A0ABZ0GU97_9GAMM|nr:hypothetical protein RI844_09150 [Colwelliaceae bacterium S1-1]